MSVIRESSSGNANEPAVSRLLVWLSAYEARVGEAASRGAAWQCRQWGVPCGRSAIRAWYIARDVWLGPPEPISAFMGGANRLALLDSMNLRRVLVGRTLYASRAVLRKLVTGSVRRALCDVVGEHVVSMLTQQGVNAPSANALHPADFVTHLLADHAAQNMARAGMKLFEHDAVFTLAHARTLIEFSLDQDDSYTVTPPTAGAWPDQPNDPRESADFLLAAGMLFPELKWLFG
ncbi:type III secretion protein HrpB4 [Burkholderia sp. MSMB1826]|uniref:type III secretion protein HrpB4 n=1 Tax=Burkholderia sp. MSMB1826 TaxID=1637875 RepID=UPI0015CFD4A8|nr:type III secretion protein HrpB4 [Burkholderia sp. MSMB1826]